MDWDVLKLIVIFIALVCFNLKVRSQMDVANRRLVNIGLCLLLFASLLDFTDGIPKLNNIPILGTNAPLHDTLEDQLGDTSGLLLFTIGVFRQILSNKR